MSKLAFLGDVYLKYEKNLIGVPEPFIFNYECVAADDDAKPMINKINLRGKQDFNGLSHLPMAVNLANNHILDYLDKGVYDTIKVLKDNNVHYFGVGTQEDNYNNPCILDIEGKQIALLGYNDITHSLKQANTVFQTARPDEEQIRRDIDHCKQQGVGQIIIQIHWGREERFWNTERQRYLGRLFVDLGATLVIGHHSHCIQPVECYKGRYIFYSLGNAYFPDIAVSAYYNSLGESEFVMHKKHFPYGRKSLKVIYDIEERTVVSIHLMELKGDRLLDKGEINYSKVVHPIYQNRFINSLAGYGHMLALFLRGYLFADGKLFSLKAIKKEVEFLKNRR